MSIKKHEDVQKEIDIIFGSGEWKLLRYNGSKDIMYLKHKCGKIKYLSRGVQIKKGNNSCLCNMKLESKKEAFYKKVRVDQFEEINNRIKLETNGEYVLTKISTETIEVEHKCGRKFRLMDKEFFEEGRRCKGCTEKNKKDMEEYESKSTRSQMFIKNIKEDFKSKNGCMVCEICGFDFEKIYGERGIDFIEAHHIKTIAYLQKENKDIENITLVCSNCHRMLHRSKPPITPNELKEIISNNKKL